MLFVELFVEQPGVIGAVLVREMTKNLKWKKCISWMAERGTA